MPLNWDELIAQEKARQIQQPGLLETAATGVVSGITGGIEKKYKSVAEQQQAERENYYKYALDLFSKNQPYRLVNGQEAPLAVNEQVELAKTVIQQKAIPQGIFFKPTRRPGLTLEDIRGRETAKLEAAEPFKEKALGRRKEYITWLGQQSAKDKRIQDLNTTYDNYMAIAKSKREQNKKDEAKLNESYAQDTLRKMTNVLKEKSPDLNDYELTEVIETIIGPIKTKKRVVTPIGRETPSKKAVAPMTATNPRTGQKVISYDNGTTWQVYKNTGAK